MNVYRISLPITKSRSNQVPPFQQALDIQADEYVVAPDRTLTLRNIIAGAVTDGTKRSAARHENVATFQPFEWANVMLLSQVAGSVMNIPLPPPVKDLRSDLA